MNYIKPLLLACFLTIFSNMVKASETVRITKKLQWNDLTRLKTDNSDIPDFDGAWHLNEWGGLPCLVTKTELRQFATIQQINWISTSTASFNAAFITQDQQTVLQEDWKIDARVTEGGGKFYLVVAVLPLRKTPGGMIDRLTGVDIEISIVNANPSSDRTLTFADHSVLSEGTWYKVAIARDGVYKMDKSFLNQLGVNSNAINPQNINVYGNGGQLLPEDNQDFRYDDLQKCSIFIQGESDGSFNEGDFILFYGKGPDTWKKAYNTALGRSVWAHNKHYYSDSAYYYIRIDDVSPKRLITLPEVNESETHVVTKFQDYQYIENDLFNLVKSGREFYGDQFDLNTTSSFNFNFPNISTTEQASLETIVAVRSVGGGSKFKFNVGDAQLLTQSTTTSGGEISPAAGTDSAEILFIPNGSNINVAVEFQKFNAEAQGWIDYIRINASRNLVMSGNQMRFRDTTQIGAGNIGRFQLGSANAVSGLQIWDITDYTNPAIITAPINNSTAEWKLATDVAHEFVAFGNNGLLVPSPRGQVANQDLHSLNNIDLIIVSAPGLREAADQLAQIHSDEGQIVAVVSPQQVFNEFSCGNPDVTAIRMLMKMLYDRAGGNADNLPRNLCLFGDGSYQNNKGWQTFLGNDMIVFESDNSLSPTQSYVSDDYFVLLGDDDTGSQLDELDAGVGRIPASDLPEALGYVEKVRTYISQNTNPTGDAYCLGDENGTAYGPWRNILTFVSDDQDGNGGATERLHLDQSNELADSVQAKYPQYDVVKIFMDAYKQEPTPGGERYPDGENAIRQRIESGSLIVTYIGHGGERGWAHERILSKNTISNFTNKYKLPVFLTATCELARYDDPSYDSAGEVLVMNPNGGAIAMLTTTRIVFAGDNFEMDKAFFKYALESHNIPDLSLGMINMLCKNEVSDGNYSKPNFSLLGDPALKMSYPKLDVYTTHINGNDIMLYTDTLKALQEAEFKGYIGDVNGNKLTNFNGFVYPTVFDKITQVQTLNNDGGDVQVFNVYNKNIFKGKASVTNGDFSFKFIVPYDINYSVGNGRVSYYAVAGNDDGHGYSYSFKVGASLNGAVLNNVGPQIELFLNDTTFISGGVTNTEPILIAQLKDENGVNTVGNGIGHDLTAILDNDTQNPIVLNEFYETDLDTYKSGEVRYQLFKMTEGQHTILLKAWDVHNNSSTSTLDFLVANSSTVALQHVLNYPNPFTTRTQFMFEHNQACESLDVRIQVFTVSGKLVKTLDQKVKQNGFRSEPIAWDGLDDFGDRIGKGVYVYKIEVRNESGGSAEQFEKLVILN
jgi:hypothetical protein